MIWIVMEIIIGLDVNEEVQQLGPVDVQELMCTEAQQYAQTDTQTLRCRIMEYVTMKDALREELVLAGKKEFCGLNWLVVGGCWWVMMKMMSGLRSTRQSSASFMGLTVRTISKSAWLMALYWK
jgi:hypothetical protein